MMDKLIFIIAMIIAFYISISSIQNFSIKFETLDAIIKEFKAGFISDIIATNTTTCPTGYEPLVKNFDWPGNFKGCGCKAEDGSDTYVFYSGYCPKMRECHSVEETNRVSFNKWRGSLLCYKRSNITYEHFNLIEDSNLEDCINSTHKVCGVIDGHNNILCMRRNESCPITTFEFLDSTLNVSTNSTEKSETNRTYKESYYPTNRSKIMHVNNQEKNDNLTIIPSFIRIDITKPCLDPSRSPSSELFFPLMKSKYNLMCDTYENSTEIVDMNFAKVDTYPLGDYYKDNNYFYQLDNLLSPFKIDINNKTVSIYKRGYSGWSLYCLKSNPDSLKAFLKTEDTLDGMLISTILHSFILIAVIIAIGVAACFFSKYFDTFFKLVNIGFIVLNLIYPIQIISRSNWIINVLTDENGAYCGDSSLNLLLIEISSSCLDLQYSYMIILLLAIIYSLIFFYSIYRWVRPFHEEYQARYNEMVNQR